MKKLSLIMAILVSMMGVSSITNENYGQTEVELYSINLQDDIVPDWEYEIDNPSTTWYDMYKPIWQIRVGSSQGGPVLEESTITIYKEFDLSNMDSIDLEFDFIKNNDNTYINYTINVDNGVSEVTLGAGIISDAVGINGIYNININQNPELFSTNTTIKIIFYYNADINNQSGNAFTKTSLRIRGFDITGTQSSDTSVGLYPPEQLHFQFSRKQVL